MEHGSITIATSYVETTLPATNLSAVIEELEAIAATNPPRPDVTNLIDTMTLAVDRQAFDPDDDQSALLLRATDHLRNLRTTTVPIEALRRRLIAALGAQPITYDLLISDEQHPPREFASYSLAYELGDRLVPAGGRAFKVISADGAKLTLEGQNRPIR